MKALTWLLAIGVALAAAAFGARTYAGRAMSSRAVTPKAMGSALPDSTIPFARVAIPSGDRTLIGWWVRAVQYCGSNLRYQDDPSDLDTPFDKPQD